MLLLLPALYPERIPAASWPSPFVSTFQYSLILDVYLASRFARNYHPRLGIAKQGLSRRVLESRDIKRYFRRFCIRWTWLTSNALRVIRDRQGP